LNKFFQFPALAAYFSVVFFPKPLANVAKQKSLYEYSSVRDMLLEFVPKPTGSKSKYGIYFNDFQLVNPPLPSTLHSNGSFSASFSTA
jgi:hypothetical protein